MIDALSIVLRSCSFIAMFLAVGMAMFAVAFHRRLPGSMLAELRRQNLLAGAAALILVFAHFALEPARMGGSLSGIADRSLWDIALDSPPAEALLWRVVGLLALLAGLTR